MQMQMRILSATIAAVTTFMAVGSADLWRLLGQDRPWGIHQLATRQGHIVLILLLLIISITPTAAQFLEGRCAGICHAHSWQDGASTDCPVGRSQRVQDRSFRRDLSPPHPP